MERLTPCNGSPCTVPSHHHGISPLGKAVAKARGDIRSEEDMNASIDFLNQKASEIKDAATPPDLTEQAMLDWLQAKAEEGCVSMCFEVDGGVHVTLEPLGGECRAARNANTIRDGIILLMKEDFR